MNKGLKNTLILGATLTLGAALSVNAHGGKKKGDIKCKGVAMAGQNDCGANGHGCGGMAKTDYDPNEWKYMSKADCVKAKKKVAMAKGEEMKMKKDKGVKK